MGSTACDLIIIGGGLAGASLGRGMARFPVASVPLKSPFASLLQCDGRSTARTCSCKFERPR